MIESIAEFDRPPVVEVVLGVQFDADTIDLEVLAEFARDIKPMFPMRRRLEPLQRTRESFHRPPPNAGIEFRFGPPLPLTQFLTPDDRFMVQLQGDRLTLNWRRVEQDDKYPRYRVLRPKFDEVFMMLLAVLERCGRDIRPLDYVEVSYTNELATDGESGGNAHPGLANMLTTLRDTETGGFLPRPEDVGFQARFRIPSPEDGLNPVGRLTVTTEPGYRSIDQRPIYLLMLRAGLIGAFAPGEVNVIMDIGREWVVKGFLELTTPAIQETWGTK
jgi:uncharacterized protein (TIGR04255 family)